MIPAQLHLTLPLWLRDKLDESRLYVGDDTKVGLAIELARGNVENRGGGPSGAAVFTGEGRLVAVGVNRVIPQSCSVAHAEIMAYMLAQQRLQRHRLNEGGGKFILATSAQPCCQYYGAT